MKFWFILLACIFIFSFCKKDEKVTPAVITEETLQAPAANGPKKVQASAILIKPEKIIYVSNQLKEWGYFQMGSYWIYKDTINNALDSVFVRGITTTYKKFVTSQDTDLIYEEIRIQLKEYGTDWILKGNTISKFGGAYGATMRIFDLDSASTVNLPAYGVNKNHSISNFSVLNTNYGNVRCFAFKYFFNGYGHTATYDHYETYYWKKNIGFVKMLYGQTNHYATELLRYHIVQ